MAAQNYVDSFIRCAVAANKYCQVRQKAASLLIQETATLLLTQATATSVYKHRGQQYRHVQQGRLHSGGEGAHLLYGTHTHKLSGHVAVFHCLLQCQLAQANALVIAALGSLATSILQLLRGWMPVIRPLYTDVTT